MNVDDLKVLLDWKDVFAEERPIGAPVDRAIPGKDMFTVFKVCPRDPDWPTINVVCDPDGNFEQLEFGNWDDYVIDGRTVKIADALLLVDDLIKKKKLLIEELDGQGAILSAWLLEEGEPIETLDAKTVAFRRVFFDSEPVVENVDVNLYVHWQSRKALKSWLAEVSKEPDK